MFLLIDNYDSFTYNLVQAFYSLGKEPLVCSNDDPLILEYAKRNDLEMVCLSPGPSRPENAGLCLEFLHILPKHIPVLGVCLGHQILGLYAGVASVRAKTIMHGKQSDITHNQKGLFAKIPSPFPVGRYHSLVLAVDQSKKDMPFIVTAKTSDNECMAIQFKDRPWVGVQFHPESILTPLGMDVLANFLTSIATQKQEAEITYASMLETLISGKNLTEKAANFLFNELMDGKTSPAQAGSILTALRMKGESALEIAAATRALLARAKKVAQIDQAHIDIVGTGGDGRNSFNCSTATALTLAGMGYTVTKHGNRAVSSTCGSADALEGLGFPFVKNSEEIFAQLKKCHFAFLFAPNFHPSFANIANVRQELGIRTLFNILGPLINPAKPSHILLGVGQKDMLSLISETLLELKQKRACVIHGAGGYDEITPIGPAQIIEIRDGKSSKLSLNPLDFGIKSCTQQDLEVHSKKEALTVLKDLLAGKGPGPMLDMIVLNVAVALHMLEEWDMQKSISEARYAVMQGAGGKIANAS